MQVLMTPLLYKDMEIDVERLDQDLFATLEEDHLGLPHVQTLRISMEDGAHADEGMSDLQAHVVCRLLNAIPRNSLTRIEYDTTYSSDKNKQRLTCVLESQTHALVMPEYTLLFVFARRKFATTNILVACMQYSVTGTSTGT